MKTSIYIAWRYLLSKSNQSLVNLVSYLSLMVVVVAAAALTVVLSAFEGLKGLSAQYAYEHSPAIQITPLNQGVFTVDIESIQEWGKANNAMVISKLSVVGLIQKDGEMAAGDLIAYYPTPTDSLEILYGTRLFSKGEMLLGLNTYYELGGEAYDTSLSVGSLIPGDRAIRLELGADEIRQRTLKAKGVFLEDDESQILGIASYEDLLYLGGLPKNSFSSLDIDETSLSKEEIASGLKGFIGGDIMVQDREDQNRSLFKLLNTEYWATYLIFSMVLVLALFSLAGSIRLIMADKSSSFSTFKQMGLTSDQIKNIFLFLGTVLSALGAVFGILLGLALVIGQKQLGWIKLSSELSYPVSISVRNLFLVFVTLLLFGFLAALISSRKLPEVSKAMRS
ncbi:MAG: FtsX-like permease family protein [Flavobacteriaceae bacterium]